jgi:hypothetical protein
MVCVRRCSKMKDTAQDTLGERLWQGFTSLGAIVWVSVAAGDSQDQISYWGLLAATLKGRAVIGVDRVFTALFGGLDQLLSKCWKGKPQPYAER